MAYQKGDIALAQKDLPDDDGRFAALASKLAALDPQSDQASAQTEASGPELPPRYQSVFRFALFNLAAFALLAAAGLQGWISVVFAADSTRLTVAIFAVFVFGLAICAGKVWSISREIDSIRNQNSRWRSAAAVYLEQVSGRSAGSRAITAAALRVSVSSRIAVVRQVANALVLLGLIGTVLGFIIALSGVDPASVGSASSVGPMVATLIGGMSVALYTTLVGAALSLWLTVNYQMLAVDTVRFVTALVAIGEANERDRSR